MYCIDQKKGLDELTLDEFRRFTDAAEEDIYEAIALDTCVRERNTAGAPGPEAMEAAVSSYEEYMKEA